jgi:hypothetical protein
MDVWTRRWPAQLGQLHLFHRRRLTDRIFCKYGDVASHNCPHSICGFPTNTARHLTRSFDPRWLTLFMAVIA